MLKAVGGRLALVLAASCLCANALANQPVIPGAAGFGITTPAGRGGKVIRVTNLNDRGAGSLRACAGASGPRVCVFEVSGTIRLQSNLVVSNPYVTIAGQTAPAPGIMLRGAALVISSSDVLVQHLAVRSGDHPDGPSPHARDSLKINNGSRNVVVDHCSFSWGIDENIETFKEWDNVTISNTIVSEGLAASPLSETGHSYGALLHTNSVSSRISLIGNLFAHNNARNPRSNAANFVFVNNVVYNPGSAALMLFNVPGIPSRNTIVGNVFIDGKNSKSLPIRLNGPTDGGTSTAILSSTRVHLADNLATNGTSDIWSIVLNQSLIDLGKLKASNVPAWPDGLKALSNKNDAVLTSVLKNAGARPADRDSVDRRVVTDVKNGTGGLINCVEDDGSSACAKNAGGWPRFVENSRPLYVPADPNGDDDGNGYTNMEEWLHSLAAEVEGREGRAKPNDAVADLAPPMPPELKN